MAGVGLLRGATWRPLVALAAITVALLGAFAVDARASGHQTIVRATCEEDALVRPLLGEPRCSAIATCPVAQESHCFFRGEVVATARLGVGMSGARVFVQRTGASGAIGASCTGPPSGCSTAVGTLVAAPGTEVAADCDWEGSSIGVFASVACRLIDGGPT